MRVDTLLRDLLEATAAKTAASRRIDRLRDVLDTEARRRLAAEGAAPSWKAPRLGAVRLDLKPAKAYVADPDAFASYVAQRHPSEVTARLELAADDLEAALEALAFADVKVTRSAVEVRPTFLGPFLEALDVLYDDSPAALESNGGKPVTAVGTFDESTGTLELVAGTAVVAPSASLVVTLDRDRKRAELDRVDSELDAEVALDTAPVVVDEAAVAHAADVGARLMAHADAAQAGAKVADAAYAADVRASDLRDDAADDAATGAPTIAAQQRAHAHARAAAITAATVDPTVVTPPPPAAGSEDRPPAELTPPLDDDEVSLGTPDPTAAALVNAAAGAVPFEEEAGADLIDQPAEPVPGVVDELVTFTTDDLKRVARARRVPLNGTKVLLAGRLARAGVTADDVLALRPA